MIFKNKITKSIILIFSLMFLISCGQSKKDESSINLSDFKTEDEYSYKGIKWGSSKEEVENIMNMEFGEPDVALESKGSYIYYEKELSQLSGTDGRRWYEFYDNGLTLVGFEFKSTEKNDLLKFKTDTLNELVKLYGDYDDEKSSVENDQNVNGYRWMNEREDGSRDTLQLIAYSESDGKMTRIILEVGYIRPNN